MLSKIVSSRSATALAACSSRKGGLKARSFFSLPKLSWDSQDEKRQDDKKLEQMKLENERMKLENERMQLQDGQRKQEAWQRKSDSEGATLKKPREELVQQAQNSVAHAAANGEELLKDFETQGFRFYSCPQCFVAEEGNVRQAAMNALLQLPSKTRAAVADLMANTHESTGAVTIYEYDEGRGELTKLAYRMQKTGSKKAVAVMPFGASFVCAKVIKEHITITETVPIFKDVPVQVLSEEGLFNNSYTTVYKQEKAGEEKRTRLEPVFDQKVLSIDKQAAMMAALETRAYRQVLKEIA